MITDFFDSLECVPTYQEAVCFVYLESNMSWLYSNRILKILQSRGGNIKIIPVSLDPTPANRLGCWTSDLLKEKMVINFRKDLSNGNIKFAKDFVSRNPVEILGKLKTQLKVFRKRPRKSQKGAADADITTSSSANSAKSTMWSYDGKVNGQPDDLALVNIMDVEYSKMTESSERFANLASSNGWCGVFSLST